MVARAVEFEVDEEKVGKNGKEERIEGYVSKEELVNYLEGLKVQREILMKGMVHGTFNHWYTQGAVRSIGDLISYVRGMNTYEVRG